MTAILGAARMLIANKPMDLRKGMDGLATVVKEHLRADPYSDAIPAPPGPLGVRPQASQRSSLISAPAMRRQAISAVRCRCPSASRARTT